MDYIIQAWSGKIVRSVHRFLHEGPDPGKCDPALQERFDGYFIRCIQNRRRGSSRLPRLSCKSQCRKVVISRFFEIQTSKLCQAKWFQGIRDPFGPSDGVLDRETHIRMAQLCQQRTIHKLDHRVHNALWMNEDLNLAHGDIKEPTRLNHLESLVKECCRIDTDFATHLPSGMLESISDRHGCQAVRAQFSERSTGSS